MTSTQDSATTRQRSAVLFLIAASALFGLDTTISAYVLRQVRPADLFLVETSVGTVILWVYLLASGRHRRPARLRPHIVLGLIEPALPIRPRNVMPFRADFGAESSRRQRLGGSLGRRRLRVPEDGLQRGCGRWPRPSGIALMEGLDTERYLVRTNP
jgi:hypothetical protein